MNELIPVLPVTSPLASPGARIRLLEEAAVGLSPMHPVTAQALYAERRFCHAADLGDGQYPSAAAAAELDVACWERLRAHTLVAVSPPPFPRDAASRGRDRGRMVAVMTEALQPEPGDETTEVAVETPAKDETTVDVPADSDLADAPDPGAAPEPFTVESKEAPRA